MDASGQQIDERRWIGATVSKIKMGAGGEDWTPVAGTNEDKETCAPAVNRGACFLRCWWRGVNTGGWDNGRGTSRFKKATLQRNPVCVHNKERKEYIVCVCVRKERKKIFFPFKHKPCACT